MDALKSQLHTTRKRGGPYLSNEPGVTVGVSPTLRLLFLRAFLSKYFFASALSLPAYSFSMTLRSR